MSFKSKYSSSEVESLLDKVNGMGDTEITKEQVESVLTGNITTHRHDTTYNYNDFETDVWDGTSISASLHGSGTKDDPYLIQSCADWLHLFVNGLSSYNTQKEAAAPTEFSPVFKLNKNLDFGNKTIPDMNIGSNPEDIMGVFCEFDGCGARISNFVSPVMENIATMSIGVFPFLHVSFVHDFVIDNAQLDVTLTSGGDELSIFSPPSNSMYVISLNNIIRVKANISGSIGENKTNMVMSYLSTTSGLGMTPSLKTFIDNYLEENGSYLGVDIEVTDNTVKGSNGKLIVYNAVVDESEPLIFSSTPMTEIGIDSEATVFEGDYAICIAVSGPQPSALYTNNEGSNNIFFGLEEVSKFAGTPKSLTEMQSASFVDELNSHLPKPAFKQDPNGGTPILIQGNQVVDYDGYVKQSVFNTTVEEINNSISGNESNVIYSNIQFFYDGSKIDNNHRLFREENFIENLGGVEATREMLAMVANPSKIIVSDILAMYFKYSLVTICKFYHNQTKNGNFPPDDGDSLSFILQGCTNNGSFMVDCVMSCSITDFNKENMTVKIIRTEQDSVFGENGISCITEKTQTEYDSLSEKKDSTLYLITE